MMTRRSMDRLWRIAPLICGFVLSVIMKESAGVPGIYLISPPTSPAASPRSDTNGMETSESLWIGSHKINWSPLPLFLKFTNPNLYQERKQQAESRQFEEKPKIIVAKKSMFNDFETEWNDRRKHTRQYSYMHHTTKYPIAVGRFPDFPPRPQLPSPYIEGRSSSSSSYSQHQQPEKNYENDIITAQDQVTTPAPIYVSTTATLLVSPPQAVAALSTPGPRISPIVEKLRRMTEWSRQHTFSKKEGRPTPVYPGFQERKLRVKKRLINGNSNGHSSSNSNDNGISNSNGNGYSNNNGHGSFNTNGKGYSNDHGNSNSKLYSTSNTNDYGNSNSNDYPNDIINGRVSSKSSSNSNNQPPKKYKHNIAEIIADDTVDNTPGPTPPSSNDRTDRTDILKYKKELNKNKESRKPKVDYLYETNYDATKDSYEDDFRPSSPAGMVIVHPTNAAFLIKDHRDLDEQRQQHHHQQQQLQSTSKKEHLARKNKKLDFFKKEGSAHRSEPMSFRFGPEDARVSPYHRF